MCLDDSHEFLPVTVGRVGVLPGPDESAVAGNPDDERVDQAVSRLIGALTIFGMVTVIDLAMLWVAAQP